MVIVDNESGNGSDEVNDSAAQPTNDVDEDIHVDSFHYTCPEGYEYWKPECDEKSKPVLQQIFSTIDAAYEFYREYGRLCGFDVRLSSAKYRNGLLTHKYIQCSHAGSSISSAKSEVVHEGTNKRKRTHSRRCECQAKITLKNAGLDGYFIMIFVEEHNHALRYGIHKQFMKANRKVTPFHQNFIFDLRKANIGSVRAHSILKEFVGSYENVGATSTDFRNFDRDVRACIGEHDADMILKKLRKRREASNNTFFYDYKVDDDGRLIGLFWADGIGRRNYSLFGDTLSFDPTFRTNKYCMVFVPFTGVDNHWSNVTFASALLANESHTSFEWVLRTFDTCMDHSPPCIITDQCPAIKKAIPLVWPGAKHRYCMWHIMNKLSGKISPSLACDKVFMNKMKACVWSDYLTEEEFEQNWESIIVEYNLHDNGWLTDMYTIRKEWIPAYFNDVPMAGLLRTTSRSESSNFYFQHFHQSGDTLVEFMRKYDSAIERQRHLNDQNNDDSELTPKLVTELKIEKDAAQLYTRQLYYLITEEIEAAWYHTRIDDMTTENDVKICQVKDSLLSGKLFEVKVRLSDHDVQCNCKHYTRRGYLCRHAFTSLHQCGVSKIPRAFVMTRWTKNAERRHEVIGSHEIPVHCAEVDEIKLMVNEIWFNFQSCMSIASHNKERVLQMRTAVKTMKDEMSHKTPNSAVRLSEQNIYSLIDVEPPSEVVVQNPNISRNKGCGTRIKSGKENSMAAKNVNRRKCGNCNQITGHNARTCPEPKK